MSGQIIDTAQLELMTSGDSLLAREVLDIFKHQSEMWGRMLDPNAPQIQWADAAHSLKGAARSIGAIPLGEVCEIAETEGRGDEVGVVKASVLINDVRNSLTETLEELAKVEHQLTMSEPFKQT